MVFDPKTCTVDTSLDKVAGIMWHADCGCLPVRDATDRIVGLITDRDIAMAAYLNHKELWNLHVSDVIQGHPLYICWPDDDVRDALAIMEREGVRRLPVLDDEGGSPVSCPWEISSISPRKGLGPAETATFRSPTWCPP